MHFCTNRGTPPDCSKFYKPTSSTWLPAVAPVGSRSQVGLMFTKIDAVAWLSGLGRLVSGFTFLRVSLPAKGIGRGMMVGNVGLLVHVGRLKAIRGRVALSDGVSALAGQRLILAAQVPSVRFMDG